MFVLVVLLPSRTLSLFDVPGLARGEGEKNLFHFDFLPFFPKKKSSTSTRSDRWPVNPYWIHSAIFHSGSWQSSKKKTNKTITLDGIESILQFRPLSFTTAARRTSRPGEGDPEIFLYNFVFAFFFVFLFFC